jgi:hypothetical protein
MKFTGIYVEYFGESEKRDYLFARANNLFPLQDRFVSKQHLTVKRFLASMSAAMKEQESIDKVVEVVIFLF